MGQYKARHNAIMTALLKAVARVWGCWDKVNDASTAVRDTQNGTIWIDVTIPTDRSIQARHSPV